MAKLYQYKIRDKSTQKYWNGNMANCVFSNEGAAWDKEDHCLEHISLLVNFRAKWNSKELAFNPDQWEIVKYELNPIEDSTSSITEFCRHLAMRNELVLTDSRFGTFADVMQKKGVLKDISYLILLKSDGSRVKRSTILESREHLRQLGVKTRTFREHQGVFGMMDKAQALKARMTLDVDKTIDLIALREKYFPGS